MKESINVKEVLTSAGFRVTNARTAVLQILIKSDKPIDVVQIEKQLHKKDIGADQVTIYRMLDAFVEKGLVTRLDFHEGKFRYEFINTDHHHVICEHCGSVENVLDCSIQGMEKIIREKQKYLIKRHALEFFGLCPNCQ